MRIQNGGQNKRKGSTANKLGKREFLPAVPTDDQYVLVRADEEENDDQVLLLLIVCMLKSVTVMA